MHIKYQKLESEHLEQLTELIKLYEQVFEMQDFVSPDAGYLGRLLKKDNVIFYIAAINNTVVGGLTAYILPSAYFSADEVYIYDLAVKADFQRKGIGSTLMNLLENYCSGSGIKAMFVQADLEDKHAIAFYKATGAKPQSVIHFSYNLVKENKT